MARNKKNKPKTGHKGLPRKVPSATPRNARKSDKNFGLESGDIYNSFIGFQDAPLASGQRRIAGPSSNGNLRNQRMNFVSASEQADQDFESENVTISAAMPEPNSAGATPRCFPGPKSHQFPDRVCSDRCVGELESRGPDGVPMQNSGGYQGKNSAHTIVLPASPINAMPRISSPTLSDSSGEVILFRGRTSRDSHIPISERSLTPSQPIDRSDLAHKSSRGVLHNSLAPSEDYSEIMHQESIKADLSNSSSRVTYPSESQKRDLQQESQAIEHAVCQNSTDVTPLSQDSSHTYLHQATPIVEDDFEDSIYADYLENIREHAEASDTLHADSQRLLHTSDDWHASDLADFENLSTSDEVLDIVDRIISKRQRESGIQYLVVWSGHTIDDAKWIHTSSLTMEGAKKLIDEFEATMSTHEDGSWETDSSGDSEPHFNGDVANDRDPLNGRADRLSDEQIARLLAKQEELGMGSDELLIYDQDVAHSSDGGYAEDNELDSGSDITEDDDDNIEKTFGFSLPAHLRRRNQIQQPMTNDQPDFLDDYGDFDIMDWDRPSLTRGKGKKFDAVSHLGLADPLLESELRASWAADRNKKRLKKQQREELRAQGLLGKKNKVKPDFSAKYKDGMSIQMVRSELELFLDADYDSRPFPPMDKRDRKALHHLAGAFNLKSKSQGKAANRFTVVFKTAKTLPFDDDVFDRVARKLERQFWPTPGGGKGKRVLTPMRSRAGGVGGWSVHDGQMVGAGAPELGSENKGRAMLEKMGWAKGNALGSVENGGILQPIEHIVKTSRTGLG